MKKIIALLSIVGSITLIGGFSFGQSIPSLNSNMTTVNISNPYTQSQCVEPNGDIVYNTKHFYLGDTYTTRDFVPIRGNGYDTLILTNSRVLVHNPAMFNFTAPISRKSNGVPKSSPSYYVIAAAGTFQVANTGDGQLVYNIHRTALYNGGNSSYTISFLPFSDGATTQTTTLNNKTFYNQPGWVVNGYECVNYKVHYCGDGVLDTKASIAMLPGGINNSIANEECDGNDGTPAGYTCDSSCKLHQTIVQPGCYLLPKNQTIICGNNAQLSFGSTNTLAINNLINIPAGIITPNGMGSFNVSPTQTTVYSFRAYGMAGSTPKLCTATVNVAQPMQPDCSLTPSSQTIVLGQNATLDFDSTYTTTISNLQNIGATTIIPNQAGNFSVTPTQTTTYSFTVNGGPCTVPKTCTAVVNVTQPSPPDCSLLPTQQTISCGETATLTFGSTNATSISNLTNITGGIITPNDTGSFLVAPLQTTNYNFTVNGAPGTTPKLCTATVNVTQPIQPDCSLTPSSQTIMGGQNTTLNFNSHNTTTIDNLQNIGIGIIIPNQTGSFLVAPTQTTNYSFTASGGACTVPKTCTAVVNVTQPPILSIQKKIINDIAYQSGDLVGRRIDFQNTGSGVAHNVILTDYLPVSLRYVSSYLFGVAPLFPPSTGMFGPNIFVTYSGFDLAPGQTGYMIITGQLISWELCDRTLNTSSIESDEIQPPIYAGAYFFCDTTTTNLTIDKQINKTFFYPGEYINFTIAVTNHGPSVAQSVKIGDVWPNLACIIPGGNRSATMPMIMNDSINPYERTLTTPLAAGQTVILSLTGQVANTPSCAGTYLNTGTLTYVFHDKTYTGYDVVNFFVPDMGTTQQCSALNMYGNSTIISSPDNNDLYEGVRDFSCYTTSGVAQTISIDCGNGERYTGNNVASLSATCHFSEYNVPTSRTIQCHVDGSTNNNCRQTVTIDQQAFGFCGDGQLDERENCDLGQNDKEIFDYLDADKERGAGIYANSGYLCHHCDIQKDNEIVPMEACFSLGNMNISIQEDEILPFRWKVDLMGSKTTSSCASSSSDGKILRDSMMCEFRIFNGALPESGKGSDLGDYDAPTVKTFTRKCDIDQWVDGNGSLYNLFKYFDAQAYNNYTLLKYSGRYALDFSTVDLDGVYGEYNIALYSVTYDYCEKGVAKEGPPIDRVCETDFTVTKPYLAQKSSFGLTPKATTVNLEGYQDIGGNSIIKKTDLDKIMVLDSNTYKGDSNVNALMTSFINKYSKLAVAVDKKKINAFKDEDISVKIVPGQNIYILQGKLPNKTTLRLNPDLVSKTPFTIVSRNINLIVEGNLTTNGMFLVDSGTITFQEREGNRCSSTQTVQGIFITNKGFAADEEGLSNDSRHKTRCAYGGLHVKGVLIGNDIAKLVQTRRSQLNHRFAAGSSNEAYVLAERRNEIFKGASVLIEYNPSLRTNLPPGADEFTKALDIYKK